MGRRTRQEKMLAKLRRQLQTAKPVSQSLKQQQVTEEPIIKPNFYQPELRLAMPQIRKDLTKSLIVTILALVLQFSLLTYLNAGGWQRINDISPVKFLQTQ